MTLSYSDADIYDKHCLLRGSISLTAKSFGISKETAQAAIDREIVKETLARKMPMWMQIGVPSALPEVSGGKPKSKRRNGAKL